MSKTTWQTIDWTQFGAKQEIVEPIIKQVMDEYQSSRDKSLMINKVREEILNCTRENDILKVYAIIDMLYNDYHLESPNIDLKDFRFIPRDMEEGDDQSLFEIIAADRDAGYDNGWFAASLLTYLNDKHPNYMEDPQLIGDSLSGID